MRSLRHITPRYLRDRARLAAYSTIWFAERCEHLISIEHDPDWAARVESWLADLGLSERVELHLCARTDEGTLASYVNTMKAQPDSSLDFVLVDGETRDSRALTAVGELKPGGLLTVEDVDRLHSARNAVARGGVCGRDAVLAPDMAEPWTLRYRPLDHAMRLIPDRREAHL